MQPAFGFAGAAVAKTICLSDYVNTSNATCPTPHGSSALASVSSQAWTGSQASTWASSQVSTCASSHVSSVVLEGANSVEQSSGANRAGGGAAKQRGDRRQAAEQTTIIFRNAPNNYSGKKILELLDTNGFTNCYDFVYVPHDFKRLPQLVNLGYFFVNFVSNDVALLVFEKFNGYKDWTSGESSKVLDVSWAQQTQGRKACIKRYRNCPVMHSTVPAECKPMVFDKGEMVPFCSSKKQIKQPRFKKGMMDPSASLPRETADDGSPNVDCGSPNVADDAGVQTSTSQLWMPDESACNCSKCELPFTMFRRRHHCRACGSICCAECAPRTSSYWSTILKPGQEPSLKRLCKDCQNCARSPEGCSPRLSAPACQVNCKNTFIDVTELEGSLLLRKSLADSFP